MYKIFPKQYAALLAGPPGVGKFEFCLNLACNYANTGERVVYITTEHSPKEIKQKAEKFGLKKEAENSFYVIDIYSWSLGKKYEKESNIIRIHNPANLNEILLKIGEISNETNKGNTRLIFHSISPLFLHNEEKDVIKFIQVLTTREKENNNFILYAIQNGVHAPSTVSTLKYLVDGYLEMRFHEEGDKIVSQIRAYYLKKVAFSPIWRTVYINENGLKIE